MGFLKTGTTICGVASDNEMQVYLTAFGKQRMFDRQFNPAYFTINDSDVNYTSNSVLVKKVVDISGDYDDNVFSLSKWQNIKTSIIRRVTGIRGTEEVIASGETTAAAD